MQSPPPTSSSSSSSAAAGVAFQPSDFDLPCAFPIGAGALAYVLRAQHRASGATVAIKVLSKVQLLQQSKVEAVMSEKSCLYALGPHPFIARLLGTMQSDDELYFVMEHLPHGDLLQHLRTVHAERVRAASKRHKSLEDAVQPQGGTNVEDETEAVRPTQAAQTHDDGAYLPCLDFHDIQLIMAQLVVALTHCFKHGYVLRDLKPENICFDAQYRCCLIDFDTAIKASGVPHTNHNQPVKDTTKNASTAPTGHRRKTVSEIQSMRNQTSQFCGTAQYVSPEMVGECCWSYSSDLWALGVICYQCLYGVYPFRGPNTFTVMKKLIRGLRPEKHFARKIDLEDDKIESHQLDTSTAAAPDAVGGEPSSGAAASRFDRVVSFITSLVRIDPTLRLGVDPLTLEFDAQQLRGHAIFADFDWSIVDDEVRHFVFPGPHNLLCPQPSHTHSKSFVVGEPSPAATAVSDTVADPARLTMGQRLHWVPVHDDAYSSYVCRATSCNPFEEWLHRYDTSSPLKEPQGSHVPPPAAIACAPDLDSEDDEVVVHRTEGAEDGSANDTSSSSGDDDDVVDDVGVSDRVGDVHADFSQ